MTPHPDIVKKTASLVKRSITFKIVSIGILILLLLIPTAMIQDLIRERQSRRDAVVAEISGKWGNSQTITGPFITLPFKRLFKDREGNPQVSLHYLHLLPEHLEITGDIRPEIRYRSLFEAVVYNTALKFQGHFTLPPAGRLNLDTDQILWDRAVLSLGITDMRGIRDKILFSFNETPYKADPGLKTTDLAGAGVGALIGLLRPESPNRFSFDLNLNGSEQIRFIPVGETNTVTLRSFWPSPSFGGAFLPVKREVTPNGFSARWQVLHLNRNFPQFWEGARYKVTPSAFGVRLILTADIYQKSIRLAKYSIMFLIFTFAAFFFSEVVNRQRIHPIQYILIGTAVLIFYTLVLSLSEHLRFNGAYIVSAASVTLIISGYARAIVKDSRFAATLLSILAVLYCYLFVVLQLADYALLLGSVGLLIIVAAVMYLTRNINWYDIEAPAEKSDD